MMNNEGDGWEIRRDRGNKVQELIDRRNIWRRNGWNLRRWKGMNLCCRRDCCRR